MKEAGAGAGAGEAVIRIFVGGLGQSVSSDDLHNIFSSNKSLGLGIESMEIIRSKGRSFAYIDFLPSSNNSLSKLFNTYNGCVWKGGKLRLEKAKEHYLARLTSEWAQDQDPLLPTPNHDDHAQDDPTKQRQPISGKLNRKDLLSENKQLRLFFPRLGKLKSIPFSGTGKHRYSFRRVEVPPLPKHFCDCEEHSGPPPPVKHRHVPTMEEHGAGLAEEELNMMNSVMNKLFQMKNVSDNVCREIELDKEVDDSIKTTSNPPLEENEGDIDEDDDNLIINIVSGTQETILTNQRSRFNIRQTSKDELSQNGLKKQKRNAAPPNKKRKGEEISTCCEVELDKQGDDSIKTIINLPLEENKGDIDEDDDNLLINVVSGAQEAILGDQNSNFNMRQTSKEKPSHNMLKKQKRDTAPSNKKRKSVHHEVKNTNEPMPVSPGGNLLEQQSKFDNASETLQGDSSSKEEPSKSDNVPNSMDSENNKSLQQENQNDHFGRIKEVGGNAEAQSTKLNSASNKTGRGYAWLSKSSWTQLIGGNNSNAFSITQILPPGTTFGKVEPSNPDGLEVAWSMKSTSDNIFTKSNIDPTISGTSHFGIGKGGKDQNTVAMSQQIVAGNTEASAPVLEKKSNSAPKQTYTRDASIGETCSFMRSAASVKEWARTKAALSGSRKRKSNEN